MGSANRKLRRKKEHASLKRARKELKKNVQLSNSMPTECLKCETQFDASSQSALDEWRIEVSATSDSIALYCPSCWQLFVGEE